MSTKQVYEVTEPSPSALQASRFMQNGPEKLVRSPSDLCKWVRSKAYFDVVGYINNTSMAIQGHRIRGDSYVVTSRMLKLCRIFEGLERLVCENLPPGWHKLQPSVKTTARPAGSNSYRVWMRQMHRYVFSMLDTAVGPTCKHVNELGQYLSRSFGSSTSLDYGPGNELMFVFFMCGLFKAGVLQAQDTVAAALMLYERYVSLIRRLIVNFHLPSNQEREHFAVDNYYVLAYIWGAAQLAQKEPFQPQQSEEEEVMASYRQDYMLLNSIHHVNSTKGSLAEHAYQLWCILAMPSWTEVYQGLERSYLTTVLGCFHSVQHAVFNELLSFNPVNQDNERRFSLRRAFLGPRLKRAMKKSAKKEVEQDEEEEQTLEEEEPTGEEQTEEDEEYENDAEWEQTLNDIENGLALPVELYVNPEPGVYMGFRNSQKLMDYSKDMNAQLKCIKRNLRGAWLTGPNEPPEASSGEREGISVKYGSRLSIMESSKDTMVELRASSNLL